MSSGLAGLVRLALYCDDPKRNRQGYIVQSRVTEQRDTRPELAPGH
jgi:hypothetical protein